MYDVLIVGARCAGSALAHQLARAGLKVASVLPRSGSCRADPRASAGSLLGACPQKPTFAPAARVRSPCGSYRQPELAADDGRVAGAPAMVGDDRRSALHDRNPLGSVIEVTSTAPSTKRSMSRALSIRQTRPATTASPTPSPFSSRFPAARMG
jgi:hypothetical protein